MRAARELFGSLAQSWARTAAPWRLVFGCGLIILIGLAGLTPKLFFGVEIAWPLLGLIAATGWGRSGMALAPLMLLIVLGFAHDVSQAPWGSYGLANLLTFGFAAFVFQTFEIDRNPALNLSMPFICITFGGLLLWVIASVSIGHPARITPLIAAFFTTVLTQIVLAPIFDLGTRHGLKSGARG